MNSLGKLFLACMILLASPAYAVTHPGGVPGDIQINSSGGYFGWLHQGGTLSSGNSSLNTTVKAPRATITTSTDTILSSDFGSIVTYNNTTGAGTVAAGIASAATSGFTQGYGVTLKNLGLGTVTITATGSTINGLSSFPLPRNTGCFMYSDGTNYQVDLSACTALSGIAKYQVVTMVFEGSGTQPSTGPTNAFTFPSNANIVKWVMAGDTVGSAVVDVWKTNGSVPSVSNTITASALPTLSSAQYATNTTLTGWTTSVAAGDVFVGNLNSVSTFTKVTLQLYLVEY